MELILRKRIFLMKLAEILAECDQLELRVAARNELWKYDLAQYHDAKYGHLNVIFPFELVRKARHLISWGVEQGWLSKEFETIEHLHRFSSSASSAVSFAAFGPYHMAGAASSPGVAANAKPSFAPLVIPPTSKQGTKK